MDRTVPAHVASRRLLPLALLLLLLSPTSGTGQEVLVRDLTVSRSDVPVRLVGYGIVVGLEGTGDRVTGRAGGGHTVRSVTNLLRRFDIEVPEDALRTRNVAAVLVTAEVSPYLRPGGRFTVHVSSVGDAASLRGGVLWITPLLTGPGAPAVATAQGPLLLSGSDMELRSGDRYGTEATARIPEGGLLQGALPRTDFGADPALLLRNPDLGTAARIASRVNELVGAGTATVEDPGSITLDLPAEGLAETLVRIGEIPLVPDRPAQLLIDGRDGLVVSGGDLIVAPAVVSHGALTLSIGEGEGSGTVGDVRVPAGTPVQDVASALHAVGTPPAAVAAIFESLQAVGALSARVVVR